jgi:hypothetical protein
MGTGFPKRSCIDAENLYAAYAKSGAARVKSRRICEGEPRKTRSRFYYSAARNTVLRCNMMIKA